MVHPADRGTTSTGFGIASLVLGIIAVALAAIPFLGFLGLPMAFLAIGLGVIAMLSVPSNRATHSGPALAGAGIILGIVAFVMADLWPILLRIWLLSR